ncbi:MAG: NUDIX hydrolase [Nitrospinae bacterium RIFCSPLOWO2_12_FULL_47_7]|nr:MAG: NUDIX hydrolase [Nitrospinae bacterium RIFCSPLOWO2_12_FULL_47_7]
MKNYNINEVERFDVVDDNDKVIGSATRKEIHEKSLFHRSVHMLVFNVEGQLFLQKRVLTKDENPGLWDTSAAGHVNTGEDYFTGAQRELHEELSIAANLVPFLRFKACAETFWEHVAIYTCVTTQTIVCDPSEISEGRYWSIREVKDSILANPEQFTSTFRIIFNEHLKQNA